MKNPEDHKKLLDQIEELSRNSINYFDVEKEFFLIDSENLSQVRPRFYGYSIQRDGIYEEENLTPEAISNLDGRGCYIYIDVKDNEITIKQDLNGCWGIYLFRNGNYFALSNSFFRLLDHVKYRYPLTVNRDFCHYAVTNQLCAISYAETAVNEIQTIDRSAVLHIDRARKNFEIEMIYYKDQSVSPDSEEGIAILDRWIDLWSGVINGLIQQTKFFQADLSGGFDSRIAFVPLLNSGVDLKTIRIRSTKNELHTHVEDYAIASQIASHYGFKLNQPLPENQVLNYSLTDEFDINLYFRQLFSNITSFQLPRRINKLYSLSGYDGETLRYHWQIPLKEFMKIYIQKANSFSMALAPELRRSFENIFDSNARKIRDKYGIEDENSVDIMNFMYLETRGRYHFGKALVSGCLSDSVGLAPAIDPDIRTLKLNSTECPDYNLMITLLFARYAPDLLNFPFQGGRSIAPETIDYAKKVNERFPIWRKDNNRKGTFHLLPRDKDVEKFLSSNKNNPKLPKNLLQDCLKAIFDSSRTYGLFTSYFNSELYYFVSYYYERRIFERERPMFALVGVAKVIEDVEISRKHPMDGYMQRFIEQDFAKINDDIPIDRKFLPYITARIDINWISALGDLQIISNSDERSSVEKIDSWQNGVTGYIIHSYAGNLEFVVKATANGQIKLLLRGIDERYPEDQSKSMPYWIDYTKLTINDKTLIDKITPSCYGKSYIISIDLRAGAEIKTKIEWLPHRSDT